jgi:phosphatidyl-myo-inositol alpha-mannosyltransferase
MKIGLVCPYNINRNSGVMAIVLALQSGLQARGHDVRVITPRPRGWEGNDLPNVIFMGVSTDFRSPAQTTTQLSSRHDEDEIDAILKREKFDVLHFHEPWVPLLSRQLLQRSSSVNIATFHQKIPETIMTRTLVKVVNPYFKSVMKYLHVMTAVSKAGAEYAANMTDRPIVIVPNGVDIAKYRQPVKPTNNDKQTILYIGRLEGRKGLKYLLEAYQLLVAKHPNTKLLIAGDGAMRQKLEMLAEDLGLTQVKFLGYVSEELKVELLAQADLFCTPALFGESFGIVLLEAMASGIVTVAGNNSGYVEVMRGMGQLSIVNPRDTEEFARRLELLLKEDELRKMWQKWATGYVEQFDYPKIVGQYEKVYHEALKQHGKKSSHVA